MAPSVCPFSRNLYLILHSAFCTRMVQVFTKYELAFLVLLGSYQPSSSVTVRIEIVNHYTETAFH